MPRGPKGEKRPADVIGAAVMVGRIATGEIDPTETLPVMDPTYYPDPSLAEYIASAGYPTSDGEPIA